jgi:hypothetical protein
VSAPAPLVVGEMALRDLLRRRAAMAVLVTLPLALYLARRDAVGQSVRSLLFGVSWAMSTVAFFAAMSAREVEPRLRLSGWRPRVLVGGRLAGLLVLASALCLLYAGLVAVDRPIDSHAVLALDFAATALVAVAFGTALGAVIHRELDGALVIFFVAGLQAVMNPFDRAARYLPFWSSRELGTVAVDGAGSASLAAGIIHAAVVVVLCAAVALTSGRRRLR